MTTTTREIERKYALPAGGALPDLGGVAGVAAVSGPESFTHEAIYFDTADLRLARHGVTLRRRTGGVDDGWHLKLPADGARDEIAVPLTDSLPDELTQLVQAYTRGAPLAPVGRIVTNRTRRLLEGDGGVRLAEVVADEVSAQAFEPTGSTATVTSWAEAEVELADGELAVLDEVEAVLHDAGIERAASPSKLAQLLSDRLPAPPRAVSKRSTAGEAIRGYLREQYRALLAYDPRVRRDEHDAVHKMRVAARRSRSTLQAFGALFARPLDDLIAELRWLGAELGAVRDLDVLPGTLGALLDPLPDELIVGPVRARITSRTASDRAQARDALLATLRGERYLALLTEFEALVDDPPYAPEAAFTAHDGLRPLVRRTLRRVERRVGAALVAPPGHARDVAIHEARKAAKRARYAGEAAAPALGRKAAKYANAMKELQEFLGVHQDGVVARGLLRTMGMQAHLAGENAFTYGLLYGRAVADADAIERELPERWHDDHPKLRHLVGSTPVTAAGDLRSR